MTVSSCYRCYHLPPVGELNCPRILENLLRSFEIAFNFFSMAFTLRMPPCTSLHFIPLPFFFLSFLTLFSSLPATQTYSNSPPLLLSSPSDMQVKTFPAADAAGFSETTSAGWSYCISLACSSLAGFLPSSSCSSCSCFSLNCLIILVSPFIFSCRHLTTELSKSAVKSSMLKLFPDSPSISLELSVHLKLPPW